MYQFRAYTDRIYNYRQKIRNRVIRGDSERAEILADAYKKYKNVVPLIKKPLITKEVCSRMTIRIEDDDIFAGNKAKHFCGSSGAYWPLMADIEHEWTMKADGLWHNPESDEIRLCIAQEDIDKMRTLAPVLAENNNWQVADAWLPEGAKEFFELGACDYGDRERPGIMMLPAGHLTPGWPKIINVGYGAIRAQAQAYLDAREGNIMGNDMQKYMFYQAAAYSCEAASILVKRNSEACAEKAKTCEDPKAPCGASENGRRPPVDFREPGPRLLGGLPGCFIVSALFVH